MRCFSIMPKRLLGSLVHTYQNKKRLTAFAANQFLHTNPKSYDYLKQEA
jgi:hypothetical protein